MEKGALGTAVRRTVSGRPVSGRPVSGPAVLGRRVLGRAVAKQTVFRRSVALVLALILAASVPSWDGASAQVAVPFSAAVHGLGSPLPETVEYSKRPYEHFSPVVLEQAMEDFGEACAAEGQEEEVIRLYDLIISEYDRLATMSYMAQLKYDRDVSDEAAAREQAYTTDLLFQLGNEAVSCINRGLQTSYRPVLEDRIGTEYISIVDNYQEAPQEHSALAAEEQELLRQYDRLAAGDITVDYNGGQWDFRRLETEENISTQEYRDILEQLNRERNQVLGSKYMELVQVRTRIAQAAGYENYAEYAYEAVYGRDYTMEDAGRLCENVKNSIVPLNDDIWYTDVDSRSYESLDTLENSSTEEMFSAAGPVITGIAPELGSLFQYMEDYGLYDIQAGAEGEDRTDSSYTVALPSYKDAFVFISRNETFQDYQSLIHEFGHFSSYCYNYVPELYQGFNVDVCEIQSQALELLAASHGEEMVGAGAGAYLFESLTDMLNVTITACMLQEFETAVYRNPHMTLEDMNRKFSEIQASYNGWYYKVYGDECYGWVDIPHLFQSPMYYTGYGTSALSALDLWVMSMEDWDLAVDTYMGILQEGMDAPYRETISKWNMRDIFVPQTLESLAQDIRTMYGLTIPPEPQGNENPTPPPDTSLPEQTPSSVPFILVLGVGTIILLQVMILCVAVVVLWVLVKKREQ